MVHCSGNPTQPILSGPYRWSWFWISCSTSTLRRSCKFFVDSSVLSHLFNYSGSKLLGVSRSWKSILTSCPELWRHLDFSYAGKTATVGTLFTYAKRANWAATRASFHINRESDIEVMGWIMGRCKALERLDIRTGPHFPGIASLTETSLGRAAGQLANLKTLVLSRECQILLNTVSQLIGCLASLERAEFHGLLCRGAAADWKGDMLKIRELAMSTVTDSTKTSGNKLNLVSIASYSTIPDASLLRIIRLRY